MTPGFALAACEPGQWPADDADWMAAVVPGGVHESLLAAGRIPEPFFGAHDDELRWVEDTWWCYRARLVVPRLDAPADRCLLTFHGLDGPVDVRVDEDVRAHHRNQHRPLVIDVTDRAGTTAEVWLRFRPALSDGIDAADLRAGIDALLARMAVLRRGVEPPPEEELRLPVSRTRVRKAAFSWGWDFAPRLASIGIHRPVTIGIDSGVSIDGVHIRTVDVDPAARAAVVAVTAELDERVAAIDALRLTVLSDGIEIDHHDLDPSGTTAVRLSGVDCWWPHDLGTPKLYDVRVDAVVGDAIVDTWQQAIGFRTIELNRDADAEGGRAFQFRVNGVPIFARGANWVPASMFVGSITPAIYERSIAAARHAGMNMIRIWGGGIYEPDVFYEVCDRLGILVWQDFMFACDNYPGGDAAFRDEVSLEAAFQVRRLRNHSCLALWAGNNEVHALHQLVGGDVTFGDWGWRLFHEVLPDVVERVSPGALYWPSSPWGEGVGSVNGVEDGDRHAWEVWHGATTIGVDPVALPSTPGEAVHFRRYAEDRGRFISEFGIHAAPEVSTLRRWVAAADLELNSPGLMHHNKDKPKDKGWALMAEETGEPADLGQYVEFSMACQAEGLKFGVEHYRRRQPLCNGTLVWQLNDPWPGLSWSVLDYELTPKAAYWFLQRAYRPVIASFDVVGDELVLWATNSGCDAADLELTVSLVDVAGVAATVAEVPVRAGAFSSAPVWRGPLPDRTSVPWVVDRTGTAPANRRFLTELKHLPFAGSVAGSARATASGVDVELASTGYSYFTRVTVDGRDVLPDTNYFDLYDGGRAVVHLPGLDASDLGKIRVSSWGRPVGFVQASANTM